MSGFQRAEGLGLRRLYWCCLAAALISSSCASVPVEKNALGKPLRSPNIETARVEWQDFADGLRGAFITIEKPRLEAWALRIDLSRSDVEVVMNPPSETPRTLPAVKVSSFLKKYDCLAAINGGPFDPVSSKEGEARALTGIFISHGVIVSPPAPRYDALVFYHDGSGAVLRQSAAFNWNNPSILYAAGGFSLLLEEGVIRAAPERTARHPRSAAGFAQKGTILYLLVIDGRRWSSIGATEAETAALLKALGAEQGLNLDGGGSTALALRKNGRAALVNRVSGMGERAVASCIGVRLRRPQP